MIARLCVSRSIHGRQPPRARDFKSLRCPLRNRSRSSLRSRHTRSDLLMVSNFYLPAMCLHHVLAQAVQRRMFENDNSIQVDRETSIDLVNKFPAQKRIEAVIQEGDIGVDALSTGFQNGDQTLKNGSLDIPFFACRRSWRRSDSWFRLPLSWRRLRCYAEQLNVSVLLSLPNNAVALSQNNLIAEIVLFFRRELHRMKTLFLERLLPLSWQECRAIRNAQISIFKTPPSIQQSKGQMCPDRSGADFIEYQEATAPQKAFGIS